MIDNISNGTSAPVAIPASIAPTAVRPEFIRLPRNGEVDSFASLNRSAINELVLPTPRNGFKPPVKSISLRKPGQQKGIRLVHLQSLLDYLHSFEAIATKEAA